MNGPSEHLSWDELCCHDGTPYPAEWRADRGVVLGLLFEAVRELLGNHLIVILSGYRTPEYNSKLEGAALHSQHIQGRAVDICHPQIEPRDVFLSIISAQRRSELPMLGGLGLYRTFVHMDTRPKPTGRLALWTAKGVEMPS